MRKILLSIILIALFVCGCARTEKAEGYTDKSRFIVVEQAANWWVVVDKDTNVMYAVSCGYYNSGTFTLLVDSDGKPLLWEGE